MASCMGIDVYKDTTSRLHGYGRVLLVVKSPAWMYLISSRLFSRCAGTSFSKGLRALASSHERRCVGPLVLDQEPITRSVQLTYFVQRRFHK